MQLVPSMISEACNIKYYWKEKGEKYWMSWEEVWFCLLLIILFIIVIIYNRKIIYIHNGV